MECFSELENNMFLHRFKELSHGLEQKMSGFRTDYVSDEEKFALRVKLYSMMESFPIYVLEKIHPEQVFLYLENNSLKKVSEFSIHLYQLIHSVNVNFETWNRFIREYICCQLNHKHLKVMISQFPVMTDWHRFPSVNWKYLPFMSWEKISSLKKCIQQSIGDYSLGIFYRKEWIKLPEKIQKTCMTWLRFKMQPKSYQIFENIITCANSRNEDEFDRKAYEVLGHIMKGSLIS